MVAVLVVFAEELTFGFIYVLPLCRQKERQRLLDVLLVYGLDFRVVDFLLCLTLLFDALGEFLTQFGITHDSTPLSECVHFAVHLVRGVPRIFDKAVYEVVGQPCARCDRPHRSLHLISPVSEGTQTLAEIDVAGFQ